MGETKLRRKTIRTELDSKLNLSPPTRELLEDLAIACSKAPTDQNATFQYAFALSRSTQASELRYAVSMLDCLVKDGYKHQVDCMYGSATALYLLGDFKEARVRGKIRFEAPILLFLSLQLNSLTHPLIFAPTIGPLRSHSENATGIARRQGITFGVHGGAGRQGAQKDAKHGGRQCRSGGRHWRRGRSGQLVAQKVSNIISAVLVFVHEKARGRKPARMKPDMRTLLLRMR
jgi:hypothetical protein